MIQIQKMSKTEKEIMKLIWEMESPVTVSEVSKAATGHEWSHTTVATFLYNLSQKGLLRVVKKGNTNLFYPEVSCEDYKCFETVAFLEEVHDSSLESFVVALCKGERQLNLTEEQLDRLKKLMEEQ